MIRNYVTFMICLGGLWGLTLRHIPVLGHFNGVVTWGSWFKLNSIQMLIEIEHKKQKNHKQIEMKRSNESTNQIDEINWDEAYKNRTHLCDK